MPLTTCPECQKSVSSEAPTCPSCGYPIAPPQKPASRTGLWWGLGCLLAVPALMTIVAIIGLLAAIAIPSFVKARTTSQQNACINNLRRIDSGKEQHAMAQGLREGSVAEPAEVSAYIRGGSPICPAGGSYTYGPIGEPPTCSVESPTSHALR
jgi:hypothetical protein